MRFAAAAGSFVVTGFAVSLTGLTALQEIDDVEIELAARHGDVLVHVVVAELTLDGRFADAHGDGGGLQPPRPAQPGVHPGKSDDISVSAMFGDAETGFRHADVEFAGLTADAEIG